MKTVLLSIVCIALLSAACKKDNHAQEGYNFTTAYKNTLNVQVVLQTGAQYRKPNNGKDTTVFAEPGTVVKAGETFESTYFVCQKNCPSVYNVNVSALAPPDFVKMTIGDKVKIDTNCVYYYAKQNVTPPISCGSDPANFFDKARWKDTKDKYGNVVRHEYVIDQADLAEAR